MFSERPERRTKWVRYFLGLVMRDLDTYYASLAGYGGHSPASIRSEMTDGHSITYGSDGAASAYGVPADVLKVLMAYRAPLVITSPDPRYFYTEFDYPVFAL